MSSCTLNHERDETWCVNIISADILRRQEVDIITGKVFNRIRCGERVVLQKGSHYVFEDI